MRRLACVVGSTLVIPALASADPFDAFRIPPHSLRSGNLALSATGNWLDHSASFGSTNDDSRLDSQLSAGVSYTWDSDPLRYSFGASASGSAGRHHAESGYQNTTAISSGDVRGETFLENWSILGSVRAYPWQHPLGFELGADAVGYYRQSWSRQNVSSSTTLPPGSRNEGLLSNQGRERDHRVRASAAIGYGRVRNANAVFSVHVLEERLRSSGALTQPLADETRTKLAELFDVRYGYSSAHERPDRYFWQDVERVLNEDAALRAGGLDPYSLLRVTESYGPFRLRGLEFERNCGWFLGPIVEARHTRSVQELNTAAEQRTYIADTLVTATTTRTDDSRTQDADRFHLGGRVEYHRPVGWNWQLDLDSQVTWPLRPGESGVEAVTHAGANWLIADRWKAGLAAQHQRSLFDPRHATDPRLDAWAVGFTSGLAYYLEDRTELFVQVAQAQWKNGNGSSAFNRNTELRLGMTYRFLGAFDAPGLVEPQRLMR